MKKINRTQLNRRAIKELIATLSQIKKEDEIEAFLKDLMSSTEITDLARRLLAARWLYGGKTYQEINLEMGMGMATINKVHFKTRGSKILPRVF